MKESEHAARWGAFLCDRISANLRRTAAAEWTLHEEQYPLLIMATAADALGLALREFGEADAADVFRADE